MNKLAQNPLRLGPDSEEVTLDFPGEVHPMNMDNFKHMFKLFLSCQSCTLVILFAELANILLKADQTAKFSGQRRKKKIDLVVNKFSNVDYGIQLFKS